MPVRPACYLPTKPRATFNGCVAKACKTAALWVFLWAFGMGAPILMAAALGRL